jgi:hypothetical protein
VRGNDKNGSIPKNNIPLAVDVGQFPSRLVQSIYHHLTAKTERITQVFDGAYKVDYDSLVVLNNKVSQTADRFHNGEYSCEIYHSLKHAESHRHSEFSRFQYFDRTNAAPTRALIYTFDFMSIVYSSLEGDTPKPERYIVEVKIDQDVELDEDDEFRPPFITRIIAGRNISVKIEHVDYVIGRALLTAVREWVDSLPKDNESIITKHIVSSARSMETVLPLVSLAGFLGSGYFYWLKPMGGLATTIDAVDLLVVALLFSLIAFAISKYFVKKSIDAAFNLQLRTFILLTAGDQNRCSDMRAARSRRNAILYGGFSLVLIPTIVNLIVALLLLPANR